MKFFVDTAEVADIRALDALGLVDGVTTNPSLIKKSGRDFIEVIREICEVTPGPVSAEVVATDAEDMIAEGRKLAQLAGNIAVKVPLTWDGLRACRVLTGEGRMVNVTLCFSAEPGAAGGEGRGDLHLALRRPARRHQPRRHGADPRHPHDLRQLRLRDPDPRRLDPQANHVSEAALAGADVVTAPPAVLQGLASHPLTDKGLAAVPEGLGGDRPEDRVRRHAALSDEVSDAQASSILADPGT
jgi:transaldolase